MPDPGRDTNTAARRGAGRLVFVLLGGLLVGGCRRDAGNGGVDVNAAVEFDPSPPGVGPTHLKVTLTGPWGQPLRLGHVEAEGNMNHAGMKPVFTRLDETRPGCYTGIINFTMGGDWFVLLTSSEDRGVRLNKKVDVPGIRPR
jgi:YtkA-like